MLAIISLLPRLTVLRWASPAGQGAAWLSPWRFAVGITHGPSALGAMRARFCLYFPFVGS